MNKIILRILGIVFFILCFLKGVYMLDPDFGWHLRMGQLILSSGIPLHDPFSYTMTHYPFVDHEWLTNVIIYLLYKTGGMVTVSLFFTATLLLIISLLLKNNKKYLFEIIFLISASLLGFGGVRPQVLGWLFFILWVKEISKPKHNKGWLFFLQLLWVNMHGSFFLGIATYVMYGGMEFLNKKKKKTSLGMCIALCAATLINPYTYRIWWEVFMQLTDGSLRWRIMEWMPGIFIFDASFWIYACIFFALLIKLFNKLNLFQKITSVLFFLMALSTARNMPLFLLISADMFFVLWGALEDSVPTQKKDALIFLKRAISGICLFVSVASIGLYCSSYKPIRLLYPEKAVEYLNKNKIKGNIFSLYGWGGYLVWNAPHNKIFIDGRMPSWRWKQSDVHQSNNADKEYREILKGKINFSYYQKKYNIIYALIDKDKSIQPIFKGYKKIYEDETATLYKL